MKTKLEHALYLAGKDFCVFPLSPNSKKPPKGMKWREMSTKYAPTIEKWWADNPDYNIAIDTGKSGLYVIDVDTKPGKNGLATFRDLDAKYGFPETLTSVTASGGEHWLYLATLQISNTVGEQGLGDGIDTRGWGGYIVAPGSVIYGRSYGFDEATPVSPVTLPDWIPEVLAAYRVENAKSKSNRNDIYTEDDEGDIARFRQWLQESAKVATEGDGGDHITYATAAKGREFGLSADSVYHAMMDFWNDRCEPGWYPDELKQKVDNAFKYANRPQGALSPIADFGKIEPIIADDFMPPWRYVDPFSIPDRQWVAADLALKKKVTILTAPPGVGKSTFTMTLAASLASGRDLLGLGITQAKSVAIYNNEDDMEELNRRMAAIYAHFDMKESDFRDNSGNDRLMMQSGENRPLRIAMRGGADNSIKPCDGDKLTSFLIHHKIELLIVDPFSETHPANENDNGEMQVVAKLYRKVAQKTDCAIMLVHHDRKPDRASAEGHIGNMHSARGASSLAGVARVIFTFHTITEKDCKKYGIPPEDRRFYARLDMAKANMSLGGGEPRFFKRIGQRIKVRPDVPCSGEEVGVIEPVRLEAKPENVLGDRAQALWEIISEYVAAMSNGIGAVTIPRNAIKIAFSTYLDTQHKNKPLSQKAKDEALRKGLIKLKGMGRLTYTETEITVLLANPTPHHAPQMAMVGETDRPHPPTPPFKGRGEVGGEEGGNQNAA